MTQNTPAPALSADDQIKIAKDVLKTEANALQLLEESITEDFVKAVDLITGSDQHLIIAGVGKSGHIGQKLAASFASTGTPSFFLHPTEASHGDLGMIMSGSVVIAISYSGETRELIDLLQYCNNRSIPVIAMTRSATSTLGRAAALVLEMPVVKEACPNGLAPTSSTTMSLALGDALVVTAMAKRGFSREDFGTRHPGGKLGKSLQTVGEYLALHKATVPTVQTDTPMEAVITAITEGMMGCVCVLDEHDKLVGLITDGDLRRGIIAKKLDGIAQDIMTPSPRTVTKDQRMSQVVEMLIETRIANIFVVEDQKPIGALHIKDLLEDGYL